MKKVILVVALLAAAIILSGCLEEESLGGQEGAAGLQSVTPAVIDEGLDGQSLETAFIVIANNENEGVPLEYEYLDVHACTGKGGLKQYSTQVLMERKGSHFDSLTVICNNGEEETYYFNIDSFFGKW